MPSQTLTTRALIAAAALFLTTTVQAGPITYNVNHVFDSFAYGTNIGSAWTVTGTITTNGSVANPGDAVGSEPGRLYQYQDSANTGEFVSYNITVANAVDNISYTFATNTPHTTADDNQGFGNWHSLATDMWANATGDLMLQLIGLRDTTNHPAGAYFVWLHNAVYLYDYAIDTYLFASNDYGFANASYTQQFATVNNSVPVGGTLGLGLLGLAALRRRMSANSIL
ncbi:MAG: hypothetical protein H6981_06745 [Gammaproteobacteria bacterium]|nr:hypothetical protein [Gammaproteobacteria bacterium]MCP5136480.1 hypothetical protein [Gammaproteobacteria bacterium]